MMFPHPLQPVTLGQSLQNHHKDEDFISLASPTGPCGSSRPFTDFIIGQGAGTYILLDLIYLWEMSLSCYPPALLTSIVFSHATWHIFASAVTDNTCALVFDWVTLGPFSLGLWFCQLIRFN